MKLRFLLLAVAGIGMFACAKDGAEGPAVPDGSKSIVLKIALPQTTRAYIEPDTPYAPDGTTISKIDVYFTNDNGTIEQSYRIADSGVGSNMEAITNGTGLRFAGLKDATRVYCVANNNTDLIGQGNSIKDFSKALSVQKPNMAQSESIFVGYDDDLTPFIADTNEDIPTVNDPDAPEAGDIAYQATITIRPLISRIEWGKITIQSEGGKKITENKKDYFVVWQNWNPTLVGIYQSNVYLTSNIFADAVVADHFATPASMADIVNGKWSGDTKEAILSYSNYGTSYNALFADLGAYNTNAENETACVPFHFFVPFAATASSTSNDVNTTEQFAADKKPHWHFQFHYESPSYTVKVYDYEESLGTDYNDYLTSGTPATGDDALKVEVGFTYPVGPGNLTYANVDRLLQSGTDTEITYQPGKIYKIEEVIFSPEIISASLTPTTDYNVIVNVSVADFESEAVTPGFN